MSLSERPSEPRVSDRGPAPKFVNPFETGLRWLVGIGAFGLFTSAVAMPYGAAGMAVGGVFFGIALVCGISALLMRPGSDRCAAQLAELARGEFLAHWRLSDDEWLDFVETEQSAGDDAGKSAMIGWFVVGTLAAGVVVFLKNALGDWRWLIAGLCSVGGLALGTLASGLIRLVHTRKIRRLRKAEPEAYIARQGFYFAGNYLPWSMVGRNLTDVRLLDRRPACLEFLFDVSTGDGSFTDGVRIPIPADRMDEAKAIVTLLSR